MATPMSKQLADIFTAIADDRQRVKETNGDERLTRPSAENAIDLSHAIFVQKIMSIQNEALAALIMDTLVQAMIQAIGLALGDENAPGHNLANAVVDAVKSEADDDRR